jgi:hypothetical protein
MCNWPDFPNGDKALDKKVCAVCGHYFGVHHMNGCHYSYEKKDECHCSLARETLEARYWAIKMREERDETKRLLEYYLGWRNANRND